MLCLLALAAWAYAAQTAAAQAPAALPAEEATPLPAAGDAGDGGAPGPVISTWDFVRMVLLLAAVVAAIYVLFLVLRKVAGHRAEERGLIRVLDSKTLAPGRSLHLVRVAGHTCLVGCSESSVNMVASIPAQGPEDGAGAPARGKRTTAGDLAGTVHDLLRGHAPASAGGAGTEPPRARPDRLAAGDA